MTATLCAVWTQVQADSRKHVLFEPQSLAAAGFAATPATLVSGAAMDAAMTKADTAAFGAQSAGSASAGSKTSPLPLMLATQGTGRSEEGYLQGIRTMEQQHGPFAAALSEPMLALSRFYQGEQQHDKAIEMLARARHLSRLNHGLDSPEQFPAIELTIASHLALHDYEAAVELQKILVQLHHSHYGDNAAEAVPELVKLGNFYFDAFERWRQELPGGSGLVADYGPETDFNDPAVLSAADMAFVWLRQANLTYLESIRILLERQDYQNPQLPWLEQHVVATLFLQAHKHELEMDRDFFMSAADRYRTRGMSRADEQMKKQPFYRRGEESFNRVLAYLDNDPATKPQQVAGAMLQLADWHFLFGHERKGRTLYAQTRELLRINGVAEAEIATLLSPEVPVQLPAFLPQPNIVDAESAVADGNRNFDGYIDVAFSVNMNGSVHDVEILQRSDNASPEIEARLLKVLHNAPFRPRLTASAEVDETPVAVRYQFAQY